MEKCTNCGKSGCNECEPKIKYKRGPKGEKGDPGRQGPTGPAGPTGGGYEYIASFYASGEIQVTDSDWHVELAPYDDLKFTVPSNGKYKITLTGHCAEEDIGASCFLGFGINGADPVGNELTNPFVIKPVFGRAAAETHTYIIDALATQVVQLTFKLSFGVVSFDPIWMTVEKISD